MKRSSSPWVPVAAISLALGACGRRPPEPDPAAPTAVAPEPSPSAPPAMAEGFEVVEVPVLPDDDATWSTSLGAQGGVRVRWRGTDLMKLSYPFWKADWAWAGAEVVEGEAGKSGARFRVDVPGLGTRVDAVARPVDDGVLEVEYTASVKGALADVVGGGLEFQLLRDGLDDQPGYAPPQPLAEGSGFRWALAEDQALTVRFDPAPMDLIIDRSEQAERVRVRLVGSGTPAGTHRTTMRVELPAGGVVQRSLAERYGAGRGSWFPATLEWDHTPVDLRHLNDGHRPAGTHGRIEVRGDTLVFADGTPARLWGTNLVGYSLFHVDHATARAQARRIAALGFNVVRLHHHDSPWVEPNVFVTGAPDSQALSDEALETLDWWVKCLQDEGIYVWLDLHTGRQLRSGDDVPAFAELSARDGSMHGFSYVNPRIEALMQDFARRFLGRANRYTKRRYADDPGVLGILVTNENDLTHHFGNLMNADAGAPEHRRMLQARVEPFARAHGLPLDAAMRPWSYGPAKLALNEVEARFHLRFLEFLRGLGVRAPVATTSFWGDDPMASLPALTVGSVIDLHGYGEEGELERDPRLSHNFINRMVAGRVEGMPTTITEWNLYPPVRDRFVAPLWMAGIASLQGWDAPMHFCYSDPPLPPHDQLHVGMGLVDPATMALMPAAALAFREEHVRPAAKRYRIVFESGEIYDQAMGAPHSAAIRTLAEQSRVEIALPDQPELGWDSRPPAAPGAIEVHDVHRSFLADDATAVVSDTGQIRRDWRAGVGTLDTPRTQAAYGWIGGRTITLGAVEIEVDTPKATVAVSALDGRPIHQSEQLLVSVAAQVDSSGGRPPLRAQAVTGRLRVRSEHARLVLRPVTTGSRGAAEHATEQWNGTRTDQTHAFELPARPTHWFRITPG